MLKKVAFTMFPVADAARARAFYEQTLGLTRGSHSADGVWTEYDLPGGGCIALFGGPGANTGAQGGASIAFEVEDLDAVNSRLKDAGVRYDSDMVHSPVCRMSIIRDTEGNSIILHQLKNRAKAG
jgi:predicted enzyme related to lactoylglutathione lyase